MAGRLPPGTALRPVPLGHRYKTLGTVASLEPGTALSTCETALRELMRSEYSTAYGEGWLARIATQDDIQVWTDRAVAEQQARGAKGVAAVPDAGLSYANFYDLVQIAEKHWEPLSMALGKRAAVLPLLKRLDNLRNAVGHSRPLLQFERDLMSGIAGQIRNQVTIHMSIQDDAGEYYPRIESVMDSFGRRVESAAVTGEVAGSVTSYDIVVRPGETVQFQCLGVDPQDRDLSWSLNSSGGTNSVSVGPSGQPTSLVWSVRDEDVMETASVQIYMSSAGSRYHRFGTWDHRAYFMFRVRPPENGSS